MRERKIAEDLDCGITVAAKVFGSKWKPCIIDAISRGYKRPSELHRYISDAAPRVLDIQLSELYEYGVVEKNTALGFPLRSEYSLTPLGTSILPILVIMNEWGVKNMDFVKQVSLNQPQHVSMQSSYSPCLINAES
jgi:DNA-binding HxlR family transcriptional regulator